MTDADTPKNISAASARRAASMFHIGNLIAALLGCIPVFPVLWFGLSMLVFAINSHHPDSRVMHFNKMAARNYYPAMVLYMLAIGAGVGGFSKALGINDFFLAMGWVSPGGRIFGLSQDLVILVLLSWSVLLLVVLPLSLIALNQIRRTQWRDI